MPLYIISNANNMQWHDAYYLVIWLIKTECQIRISLPAFYTVSAVSVTRSAVFTKSTTSSALDTALTTVPPPVAKGTARDTTSAARPAQAQGASAFLIASTTANIVKSGFFAVYAVK